MRTPAPAAVPTVPAGITAPVSGPVPVVTSAKPPQANPAAFPKTERWPNTDPAPPVPAITPGPSSHPFASQAANDAELPHPPVVHPLAESKRAESAEPDSGSPQQHPLASAAPASNSAFEMPVFVEPAEAEEPEANETVMTPPIAPQETDDALEAAWQRQVEVELTQPAPHASPSIPLAPPAVSESENPFEELTNPTATVRISETPAQAHEPPATPESAFPGVMITPAAHSSVRIAEAPPVQKPSAPAVIGLRGCCPVTLRDNRLEVPGRAEHQCEWQGVVYRLASPEAKAKFEAHPEHYAPAQGGFDVTLTSHPGQEVPGSLEHAVWYRRQLYLFRDARSLKAFSANPAKFIK
jgi:YHS domain-containing protein